MFGRKKKIPDEQADRLGRALIRASALGDAEAEEAANAPFLYARIRARIEAERRADERASGWFATLAVARRAVPALALVAIAAAGSCWAIRPDSQEGPPPAGALIEARLAQGEPIAVVSACSIATKEECLVSTDDVLALLVNEGEQETER